MDIQNHFYGHSAILAGYVGLSRVRHLAGLLQHGWVASSPLAVNMGDFPGVGGPGDSRRLLVWSHSSRAWEPGAQRRPSTPVGAPWLYLASLDVGEPPAEPRPLVIPMHGTHVARLDANPACMAKEYLAALGPATVCLHVEDLADRALVQAWRVGGNTVVSAGSRFDPLFLPRLRTGIARSSRVVSNRLSTAVWYAAAVGVPASVFGPVPRIPGESPAAVERLRELWPELHAPEAPLTLTRPLARAELGAEFVCAPQQIRELCGWAGPRSARAVVGYWAGAPARKALTVIGLGRRAERDEPAAASVMAAPKAQDFLRHPLSHLPRSLPPLRWPSAPVAWLLPDD